MSFYLLVVRRVFCTGFKLVATISRLSPRAVQATPRRSWLFAAANKPLSFAIIAISVGYAALLAHSRKYERGLAAELAAQPRPPTVASYSAVPTDESGKLGV
jgi:hypothetical protein